MLSKDGHMHGTYEAKRRTVRTKELLTISRPRRQVRKMMRVALKRYSSLHCPSLSTVSLVHANSVPNPACVFLESSALEGSVYTESGDWRSHPTASSCAAEDVDMLNPTSHGSEGQRS